MRRFIEGVFEAVLWNSRFVVVVAVVASIAAALGVFYVVTVDVYYAIVHLLDYASPTLSEAARQEIRNNTLTHVVEAVDGYLLATVLIIFALGLYELFVSDLDVARSSKAASKVLVIDTLDDLKNRLAKVILMILVVKLFENAVRTRMDTALELVYLGGAIALVGVALYLTHGGEAHGPGKSASGEAGGTSRSRPSRGDTEHTS
jgi:uncharacterized membrane protein YqhA